MEREMGFEPTAFCMASKRSTPELFPLKIRFSRQTKWHP